MYDILVKTKIVIIEHQGRLRQEVGIVCISSQLETPLGPGHLWLFAPSAGSRKSGNCRRFGHEYIMMYTPNFLFSRRSRSELVRRSLLAVNPEG